MSTLEQMAMEHHRDACLDNHTEADCVAVILAAQLQRAEAALADLRGGLGPIIAILEYNGMTISAAGLRALAEASRG